jgi:hypothetical protein
MPTGCAIGALQHTSCHHFMYHVALTADFWVVERCSACVDAWSALFEVVIAPRNTGLPWPNTTAPFRPTAHLQNATTSYTAQPLQVCLIVCFFVSRGLGWCWGMGWVHERTHSAGVHTCHTPDCMNVEPVLRTWHSTLHNQSPPAQEIHITV